MVCQSARQSCVRRRPPRAGRGRPARAGPGSAATASGVDRDLLAARVAASRIRRDVLALRGRAPRGPCRRWPPPPPRAGAPACDRRRRRPCRPRPVPGRRRRATVVAGVPLAQEQVARGAQDGRPGGRGLLRPLGRVVRPVPLTSRGIRPTLQDIRPNVLRMKPSRVARERHERRERADRGHRWRPGRSGGEPRAVRRAACRTWSSRAGARVGDSWRHRWDSLRLFTPARYDGLPGRPFPGDPWSLPTKDAARRLPASPTPPTCACRCARASACDGVSRSGADLLVEADERDLARPERRGRHRVRPRAARPGVRLRRAPGRRAARRGQLPRAAPGRSGRRARRRGRQLRGGHRPRAGGDAPHLPVRSAPRPDPVADRAAPGAATEPARVLGLPPRADDGHPDRSTSPRRRARPQRSPDPGQVPGPRRRGRPARAPDHRRQ